ncbi:arylamine N-acetyltransferase [Kitasatospora sp. NPDC001225]
MPAAVDFLIGPADFGPACRWQATAPDSHFTRSTTCSMLTADGGRVALGGNRLITTSLAGGRTERSLAAYRGDVGIALGRLPGLPGRGAARAGLPVPVHRPETPVPSG